MVEQTFQTDAKKLIDDLKSICASYGLGNDGNEFKIITQVFLYKFMNDKFAYEAKQLESSLVTAEKWEQVLADMSEEAWDMLTLGMNQDTAKLKPEHLIATLHTRQNEDAFAQLFDDTLFDIATLNQDIFNITTEGGAKIVLFERLSQSYIVDPSQRDDFCRAVINKLVHFSFEHIFEQNFDFFATLFEYLIKDYNSNSGGKYAEYYTPHAVARIMAAILVPQGHDLTSISCYDPSAGSGTLLMNLAHAIGTERCSIYTQDISQKSSGLLRLNLILNNLVQSIPNVIQGNTMTKPHHKNEQGNNLKQFDFIVSNPPFKMDFSDDHKALDHDTYSRDIKRFFAGVPKVPAKKKEGMAIYQLFLQHIIYSLKPDGKAAVVVPTGFITAQSGIDKKIRQHLVDHKMLAGVVSMPSNIFASTGTNVSILFLDGSNKDQVILVDASNLGEKIKDGKNQKTVLTAAEEQRIIEVFNSKEAQEDFSVSVSYDEIAEKNYSLSAGQYFEIKIEYVDMTHDEFTAKMENFTHNLDEMFKESRELETEIQKQLGRLGYE
tara:strand:- start:437 stop:2083 length:1647 start_codon:yes stop_codon:yes gene_type:complete